MSQQWLLLQEGKHYGPYNWEEIILYSREGRINGEDLLCSETTEGWVRADQLPRLKALLKTAPAPGSPPRWKNPLLIGGFMLLFLIVAAAGLMIVAGQYFFQTAESSPEELRDVGEYWVKEPDPAYLIETADWGELPANQIAIVLEGELGENEANTIAHELNAVVVGYIEVLNFFQLESNGNSEMDLKNLLSEAERIPGVEIAAPNVPVSYRNPIQGRFCSPLNDPMYDGINGRAYEMIGLQDAWDIIKASGVELHPTRVGVIDDILYADSGHQFSPELHIPDSEGEHTPGKVRTIPIDRSRDLTSIPLTIPEDGKLDLGGMGHGTAVTHVVAADPGGGKAGVAGILEENLEVLVSVQGEGRTYVGEVDLEDPTRWTKYTYGRLENMLEQVEKGATVINLSWGPARVGPQNKTCSAMMRKFLEIMAQQYPDVVFVGAAGNSGEELTGDNDLWGKDLPNLVTVGALNHDWDRAKTEDWYDQEVLEKYYQESLVKKAISEDTTYPQFVSSLFSGSNYAGAGGEITLSAPGTGIPVGVGPDGRTLTANGTSFAAPLVTGAIALIRFINPELNAAQIKKILMETASRQVERDGVIHTVPDNMGAGVLRVDTAVLQVINDMRAGPADAPDYPKLPPLDRDYLLGLSQVKLTAELLPGGSQGSGQEWIVTASISEAGPGGTELEIRTSGQGMVSGSTTQSLNTPGEVSWRVTVMDEHFTVRVFRLDTGACSLLE